MPKQTEAWVQLATRVPASLLHRVKVWCVEHDEMVMRFVAEALREKLRRVRNRPPDRHQPPEDSD